MSGIEFGEWLHQYGARLRSDWNMSPPLMGTPVPSTIESDCDAWCIQLAKTFGDPLPAPTLLQPWILARLESAAAAACVSELRNRTIPESEISVALEYVLVTAWHFVFEEAMGRDETGCLTRRCTATAAAPLGLRVFFFIQFLLGVYSVVSRRRGCG